MVLIG